MTTTHTLPSPKSAAEQSYRFVLVRALLLALFWLIPIYLIALSAFSDKASILAWPQSIWPTQLNPETILYFLRYSGVFEATANSVKVALLTMFLAVLLGAPAGYALARFQFAGQNLYRIMVVMTRAFPIAILALPLVTRFIQVGLYDTVTGVALIHTALALPFAVLVTSSLFMGIPRELEEAALTLGCTPVSAFLRVVMPLALPGIAATMIFSFVVSWNEVFAASIMTLSQKTLTAFLFFSLEESPLHFRLAGGFFLIVPSLIFIFAVRKYLFSMWGIANR